MKVFLILLAIAALLYAMPTAHGLTDTECQDDDSAHFCNHEDTTP